MSDPKTGLDVASVAAVGGWALGLLPTIATLLTVVWMGIRIYETDTVQKLLYGKAKAKKPPSN